MILDSHVHRDRRIPSHRGSIPLKVEKEKHLIDHVYIIVPTAITGPSAAQTVRSATGDDDRLKTSDWMGSSWRRSCCRYQDRRVRLGVRL